MGISTRPAEIRLHCGLVKQSRNSPHETFRVATNATLNPDEKTTGATIAHCRNVRALGRVSYIDWIENLKIKTEMLMNEKLPDQV